MTDYYRTCQTEKLISPDGILHSNMIVPMKPFSCFRFLHHPAFKSHRPFQRIFSLARKAACEEILIECIQARKEDISTSSVQSFFPYYDDSALRLSFFKNVSSDQRQMVGYVVFFRGADQYEKSECVHLPGQIFEAVFATEWLSETGPFLHCNRDYSVHTSLGNFTVNGVLYSQQNHVNTGCAHAALRMALSCVVEAADVDYSSIIDRHNDFCRNQTEEQPAPPYMGLDAIIDIINRFGEGVTCEQWSFDSSSKDRFYDVLYEWIESGTPTILSFECDVERKDDESKHHAVTIIGHTFDEHLWGAPARQLYFPHGRGRAIYAPSENWVNAYVLHDDNCGPYLTMSKDFLEGHSPVIIGLIRNKSNISGRLAETIAERHLRKIIQHFSQYDNKWDEIFRRQHELKRLVLRPLRLDRIQYRNHLNKISSQDDQTVLEPYLRDRVIMSLPTEYSWIVEISCHELFGVSRRKFGEIIIPDKTPDYSPSRPYNPDQFFWAARLPGYICFNENSGLYRMSSDIAEHTEIFI